MERTSRLGLAALALVAVGLALAPGFLSSTELRSVGRILVLGVLALSLNLLLGHTGIVSFGHGLFFGAGAYTITLLWLHLELPALQGLVLAPLIGVVFGAVSGLVAFRASRLYFGLLTLALSQFGFVLATQWYSLTGGENGIHGVDLPDFLVATEDRYRFILLVTIAVVAVYRVITGSSFGSTLHAIRENRERVAFLGVRPGRYEYVAFVLSAGFAGLAGGLLVILDQNSFPNLFHWTTSAEPLLMIVIGGAGTLVGPLVGAAFVVFVQEYIREFSTHVNLIYGAAVLVVALGATKGITPALLELGRLAARKAMSLRPGGGAPHVTQAGSATPAGTEDKSAMVKEVSK